MKELLAILVDGQTLSTEQSVAAFEQIMTGAATTAQTAALLALLSHRKPTIEEIVGAATVMRGKVTPVAVPAGLEVIDTCGTGGDHSGTFNISTAAALVAAGALRGQDLAIAKHGNRSITSTSGSSQVLEALGVQLHIGEQTYARCLERAGICFCFAPDHHPAMKYAGPIRAELGFRTIFNILGPLTNPAGALRQVMGVFSRDMTVRLAEVLRRLGATYAMVVCGQMGGRTIDEIATTGPTQISTARPDGVRTYEFDPETLGLPRAMALDLKVNSIEDSARVIRDVLDGESGPAMDIVCLNAAAALVVAEVAGDLATGLAMATESIYSGAAADALRQLAAITQADRKA